jgi:type I restriction enzyme, S subunit
VSTWKTASLGEIFDIARGGSPRPIQDYLTDDLDGVNWISISDASASDKFITTTKKRIRPEGISRSRMVKPGDFILTNSMSFGHPYIMKTSGCIHDGWLVLSSKRDTVDQDYFFHLLGSDSVYAKFTKLASGATVKNLNIDLVSSVEVSFPPVTEQRRIAAILDQAETLRTQRRTALALLDTLTQSIFLDMFGDPVANPKRFTSGVLGNICDLFNGYAFKSDDYVEVSNTLNCRMSNIRPNGEFDIEYHAKYLPDSFAKEYERFLLRDGDVIIAMTDMASEVKILGVPTIVDTKGKTVLLNQRVGKLLLRDDVEVCVPFLRQMLAQKYVKNFYQKFASGGVQINLGKGDLLSVHTVLPPLPLQQTFATRIQAIEALKATHRTALTQLDALFASLQHRAFSGTL